MPERLEGFTLIELMIVVAIISILAAIAWPAYNGYRVRAAEHACLAEMKSYTSFAMATIHNNDTPDGAPTEACSGADNATVIGEGVFLTATPRNPGVQGIVCSMHTANCSLQP